MSEKQSYQKVVRTFVREAGELFTVRTEDGRRIEATGEHPFWVESKGFVAAKRLARSDLLRDADGRAAAVAAVTSRRVKVRVYNFEVEKTHTYFAGGWWVHNWCAGANLPDFSGRKLSDVLNVLGDAGFLERAPKPGSTSPYRTFVHADGSRVYIDTANRAVKVQGPRIWNTEGTRKYPPRFGPHNQPYLDE